MPVIDKPRLIVYTFILIKKDLKPSSKFEILGAAIVYVCGMLLGRKYSFPTAKKIAISRIQQIQRSSHWIPYLSASLSEVFHSESD